MIRSLTLAAIGSLMCAEQAAADIVTYECEMSASALNAIISDFIFIGHDTEEGRIVVSDAVILYYNDRSPVAGRIATDTALRTTFVWELRIPYADGGWVRTQFRLTYMKVDGQATATAQKLGYDTIYQATGRCLRQSQNSP